MGGALNKSTCRSRGVTCVSGGGAIYVNLLEI